MSLLLKTLIAIGLGMVISSPVFCLETMGVEIQAESIQFDRPSENIHASQNVVITYRGCTLNTQVFSYSAFQKKVDIPDRFQVQKEDYHLDAYRLSYDFGTYGGQTDTLEIVAGRLLLKGEKMVFSQEKITIENAAITTCVDPDPHYVIRSKHVYVYPEFGYLVAVDNWIHTRILPFDVWIPTYIFGNSSYSFLGASTLPQVGVTAREGTYVKAKWGYFVNPSSTGTVDGGYLSRLGWMYGVSHSFSINRAQHLDLSAHSVGNDGFEGGGRYSYFIYPSDSQSVPEQDTHGIKPFLGKFSEAFPVSQFRIGYTWGELINDSRVDKIPLVEFRINPFKYGDTGILLSGNLGWGVYNDRPFDAQSYHSGQWMSEGTVEKYVSVNEFVRVGAKVDFFGHWYDTTATWQRLLSKFLICFEAPLHPEISFTKKLFKEGESPFEFERKYAIESDEIGLKLYQKFWDMKIELESAYVLETAQWRTVDIVWTVPSHCWQTFYRWNLVSGQLSFGIGLY